MKDMDEPIKENDIYTCPKCGSKKIIIKEQCVVFKTLNANTGKLLNPRTMKSYMSNREKAWKYESAQTEGVGCWNYECRKCGWISKLLVE